jgi:hypothetical protein
MFSVVNFNTKDFAMKNVSLKLFPLLALLLLAAGAALAQPTLSVSPAVISNTYPGVITLTITGLTNTEKVTIQRWLDGNANGTIDAGEPMVDAFKITDGGAMVISTVTNLNVPFDSNAATGAITTTLNFAPGLVIDNMSGHFVFALASPTGRFAPVTATFTVTNSTQSQFLSGVVYSNGVPAPYAVVVPQDILANNPAGATIADGSGHYYLPIRTGNFALIAVAPNCYLDQSTAPSFTLTNGMSATNDIFLTGGGPNVISGTIYDAANSNGIGGLLVQLQSGNLFAVVFTDTNGNYSEAVAPSQWKINPSKERLARRAYVLPQATFQVNATAGNVTNANIALPKGNALFYGRITDNASQPFANVEVEADTFNSGNAFAAKGYSDQNGYYTVAVLGDVTNQWGCSVNNGKNTLIANYVVNTFNSTTNVPNQVNLQNFVALPATATISGHVADNSGTNVAGVTLTGNAMIGGNNYQTLDATTDNSGNYTLAVAAGEWNVQFLMGGNSSDNLDWRGYEDLTFPHLVNIPPTNAVLNITVYPIGTPVVGALQRYSTTQFGFVINGATNVNYTVLVSTNLASTNWATLLSFQLTTNPFPIVDVNATNSARYYRVLKN